MVSDRAQRMGCATALVANLLIIGLLAFAFGLNRYNPDRYYQIVQEDAPVEWVTFWAYIAATGFSIAGAFWQRRSTRQIPWFLLGVGLFCFVVAMEEISWGQRLLGYRPPTYFLRANYQEELNFHNVLATKYRTLGLGVVIAGYGLVLPLLALVPSLGRLFRRTGVIPPPVVLAPAFLATLFTYILYPWKLTGEWVELMLGLGFMFAAIVRALEFRSDKASPPARMRYVVPIFLSWLAVLGIGSAQSYLRSGQSGADATKIEAAKVEVEALRRDLLEGNLPQVCGVHKRLYAYVEKYRQENLLSGEFLRLRSQGLPKARAEFFLDPWNLPYWVRHYCTGGDRPYRVLLYSFGPNRKRDSSAEEILGDDVGAVVR